MRRRGIRWTGGQSGQSGQSGRGGRSGRGGGGVWLVVREKDTGHKTPPEDAGRRGSGDRQNACPTLRLAEQKC
jgi:hypothetical protein